MDIIDFLDFIDEEDQEVIEYIENFRIQDNTTTRVRVNPFEHYNDAKFKKKYRFSKCFASKILDLVKDDLPSDSLGCTINPQRQVACALRYWARHQFVHKQFNSPINLYSEQNIANSIRQQTTPLPSNGHYGRPHVVKSHKPTVQYDPAKSETYRALHEQGDGAALEAEPAHTKLFTAPDKRPTPTPKATKQQEVNYKGNQTTFVNSLHEEHIQQSNSFKRLMYNVLGDTEF